MEVGCVILFILELQSFQTELLPLTMQHSFGGAVKRVDSLNEFEGWLKEVLDSEPLKGVVGNMIRRSTHRVSS
jgi:hypothetical protein